MYWREKRVLVTGGGGFVGSHLIDSLVKMGAHVTTFGHHGISAKKNLQHSYRKISIIEGDCGDINDATKACQNQDIVINMAARVGGIEYNRTHQASILYENLRIGMNMIEGARKAGVEQFTVVSSACIYPSDAIIPTPESEGFRNEPEPTNGGYGWAKRVAEKLGLYYAGQYGMKVSIVRPYNIYGPRDHFDPLVSHVIPSIICRVLNGENPLRVWGSGNQTRAFLYVTDAVRGILLASEQYATGDPVNIGTNEEVSIAKLISMIIRITKKDIKVVFDKTKPDGSLRRNSDNSKAKQYIGFEPFVSLKQGLEETIDWYEKNR